MVNVCFRPKADIRGKAYSVEERVGLAHPIRVATVGTKPGNAPSDTVFVRPLYVGLLAGPSDPKINLSQGDSSPCRYEEWRLRIEWFALTDEDIKQIRAGTSKNIGSGA